MNIDLEIITGCLNKDRKSQYELYKRSYGFLMGICRRYANSSYEADDLLNIGFLKIITNLDKYQIKIPIGIWMRKVMINCIIDEFRKNSTHSEKIAYVEQYMDNSVTSDVNEALNNLNLEEIQICIDQLPNVSKKVFNLFVVDGYSHKEIADLLKITEGTSKWHVNFSRQKLQELIKNIYYTPLLNTSK